MGQIDHNRANTSFMTLAADALAREVRGALPPRLRIILVRHGKPAIALKPRTGHHGFRRYIDAYQDAGLDPQSAPPEELLDLVKGLNSVFTSDSPRAQRQRPQAASGSRDHRRPAVRRGAAGGAEDSAREDEGAGLGGDGAHHVARRLSPRDRELPPRQGARGGGGRHPARARRLSNDGDAVLVAHGYFNAMIGRVLRRRGFSRTGSHRVRFWNAVIYERD